MMNMLHDIRLSGRSLRKSPGFASLAIVVLAVGIGATNVVFSLIDSALVRPLPYRDPGRLVMLWERPPLYPRNRVSPLNFYDWTEQNRTFESMAAVTGASRVLTGEADAAERVPGQAVTAAFFEVLGIPPIAGRTFVPSDEVPLPNVVVISEHFWRSHLGGNGNAIGRTITLDGRPCTVIGIAPAGFQILSPSDLWTILPPRRTPDQRRSHYLQVIGRLKPGRSLQDARADMALVAENIARVSPDTNRGWTVLVEPLRQSVVSTELRTTSMVFGAVVAFVLLMACANVANLLLARGAGRTREMAVRRAMGGTARHILRLLITESALLAAVGGMAGIGLSWLVVRMAPSLLPPDFLPPGITLRIDPRLALFAAALTGVVGILVGTVPAWHALRLPLTEVLASGGRTATRGGTLRVLLTTGEIAAAVLLLCGAGLLVRTLISMNTENRGFRAESVLTMNVTLPMSRYSSKERLLAFYRQVEPALRRLPGVRAIGIANSLPLQGWDLGQSIEIAGNPPAEPSSLPSAHYEMVNPGYFDALGIAIVEGRAFTDTDRATSAPVCIVNEEFVRRFLQGRQPLGAIVRVPNVSLTHEAIPEREIVGVIRQVALQAGEREKSPQVYVPLEQNVWYSSAIALRTDLNPMTLAEAARAAISTIDRELPVTRMRTMDDIADESVARPRFRADTVGAFALVALVLAAVGVFSVMTFSVRERLREFGIRTALGAGTGEIFALVIRTGARLAAAGIGIGLGFSMLLTRSLSSLLFGIKPLDPITYLGASAALMVTALIACIMPALAAVRTDPAVVLRQE